MNVRENVLRDGARGLGAAPKRLLDGTEREAASATRETAARADEDKRTVSDGVLKLNVCAALKEIGFARATFGIAIHPIRACAAGQPPWVFRMSRAAVLNLRRLIRVVPIGPNSLPARFFCAQGIAPDQEPSS